VKSIRAILADAEYRAEAGKLSGIDVTEAGSTLTVQEAFPEVRQARRSAVA
jgi:hypothetical protein